MTKPKGTKKALRRLSNYAKLVTIQKMKSPKIRKNIERYRTSLLNKCAHNMHTGYNTKSRLNVIKFEGQLQGFEEAVTINLEIFM